MCICVGWMDMNNYFYCHIQPKGLLYMYDAERDLQIVIAKFLVMPPRAIHSGCYYVFSVSRPVVPMSRPLHMGGSRSIT